MRDTSPQIQETQPQISFFSTAFIVGRPSFPQKDEPAFLLVDKPILILWECEFLKHPEQ